MSTRVNQNAQMNAACQELLSERLDLRVGQTLALGQASTTLASARTDLSTMRSLITSSELGGVLGRLAPAQFAGAQAALAMPVTTVTMPTVAAAAHSALAAAVSVADSVIAGATRDLTVEAFTGAAAELGYTYSTCRGAAVTGVELWRDNELLLLRVHDGGAVESDHAGLADASCGDRQRELEVAVARRGITFTGRKQYNHGAQAGGDLIATAVARRDPSLARATVADAEQARTSGGQAVGRGQRFVGGEAEPSHLTRERRRGGAA
ncbi:MAG TPA: hypothetical protein VN714_16275 [Trebonia sp.]|jgi:hypothetical protein|nr:hypothetical protein [Trebonia sp.]